MLDVGAPQGFDGDGAELADDLDGHRSKLIQKRGGSFEIVTCGGLFQL